jgi:hypothetical protein
MLLENAATVPIQRNKLCSGCNGLTQTMFTMLLETTAIAEISFPPVVRPLMRMTLECREVPAVYKTGG